VSEYRALPARGRLGYRLMRNPLVMFGLGPIVAMIIGYHHVHHLNALIPNYNLRCAHHQTPALHDVPTLSLTDGLRATRLKLWDEQSQRLVSFRAAQRVA
jgi:fatty acid desaturase